MDDLPETITVLGRECRKFPPGLLSEDVWVSDVDDHGIAIEVTAWSDRSWRVLFLGRSSIYGDGTTLAEAESNLRRNAHEWAAVLGAL